MTRLMIILAAAAGVATLPAPAMAQAGQIKIDIYGNDPCPRGYICVVHKEEDRYRLPKSQNPQGTYQQRQSWANRSQQLMAAGKTGAMTCSPVGPGGYTGCLTQEINQAKQDARDQQQQNSAPEK